MKEEELKSYIKWWKDAVENYSYEWKKVPEELLNDLDVRSHIHRLIINNPGILDDEAKKNIDEADKIYVGRIIKDKINLNNYLSAKSREVRRELRDEWWRHNDLIEKIHKNPELKYEIEKLGKSKKQESKKNEKKPKFKEFLNKLDKPLTRGNKLLVKLPKKEFLDLIEETLKKDTSPHAFTNLMLLLIHTKNQISEKTIRKLFEEALNSTPTNNKLYRIPELCNYIASFNKKKYCNLLKKALDLFGSEAPSIEVLIAIGKLKCMNCSKKVKEITGLGTKINPRVLWTAKDTLKKLKA